jgi:hypothetical protein
MLDHHAARKHKWLVCSIAQVKASRKAERSAALPDTTARFVELTSVHPRQAVHQRAPGPLGAEQVQQTVTGLTSGPTGHHQFHRTVTQRDLVSRLRNYVRNTPQYVFSPTHPLPILVSRTPIRCGNGMSPGQRSVGDHTIR